MLDVKNKINEQNRNRLIDNREPTDGCQRRGEVGGPGEKGEGIKKYKVVIPK